MSAANKDSVKLDIYSDVICPWCYVGKARLDEALKTLQKTFNVDVSWKPFELNPGMPPEGIERKEYMLKKFGTSDISGMQKRLTEAGAENGVRFNFELIKRVPNTFAAHRLLWFAQKEGKQHQLSETLFRKYFFDGEDIGKIDVLLEAASEVSLDREEMKRFLNSDAGSDNVNEEETFGRRMGISAVPTFILNGEIVASGAIPAAELVTLIEAATASLSK